MLFSYSNNDGNDSNTINNDNTNIINNDDSNNLFTQGTLMNINAVLPEGPPIIITPPNAKYLFSK